MTTAVESEPGPALVREADVRALASDHGQPSTATWLAQLLRLHPGEAKARVQCADVLARQAPATGPALVGGRVDPSRPG